VAGHSATELAQADNGDFGAGIAGADAAAAASGQQRNT
jgi:hypothetical protein